MTKIVVPEWLYRSWPWLVSAMALGFFALQYLAPGSALAGYTMWIFTNRWRKNHGGNKF
ncbi:hypothetical protein [Desulfobulbus sp.]|uniref:hypothetical protein n=1 Tax=Desulfobulbus sp. TaxID=895 RepID=UPI00286F7533|nr:hypothetical protein [Desulfobulbus sp.]